MHLEETQNYFIFYRGTFAIIIFSVCRYRKIETPNSSLYIQKENIFSFISHRKMEWSVLSIYFYEVQNEKSLLLTLCRNESIKDVQ